MNFGSKNLTTLLSSEEFFKTSFGNIIEWYDFSLYGIFAVSIAHSFFPNHSQFISILMTLLMFSISFAARPIGSLIFGYMGDKLGKLYSVNLSIWCMAIPTALIGLLPTYAQIGSVAPISLIILRFIQGVSAGGQFSGLIAIAVTNFKQIRSFCISIILTVSMAGSLLASIIGLISYKLFNIITLSDIAWRVPFIISGILFLIYLRTKPTIVKENIQLNYKLKDIFKKQTYEMIYMTLLSGVMCSIYYILYSYSVTFMRIHLAISESKPLIAINILFFISLICYPIFGKLADKTNNRIKITKTFTLLLAISIILLSSRLNFSWILCCLTIMVIINCGISTYMTSMFAEIFDDKYKMTACSLCYSIGAVLGGFSPSIAEIATQGSPSGFYMLLLSLSFALYLLLDRIPETRGYKMFILKNCKNPESTSKVNY